MKRRTLVISLAGLVLLLGVFWLALTQVSLSALEEPGGMETWLATQAKRWLVARAARSGVPPPPANDAVSLMRGQMNFTARCAACHGVDGRTSTDVGRGLYPRTPDLGAPEVQAWSDAELFWIIQHGLRLTGMPGFGNIHAEEDIWHLVHYVRRLGPAPPR